MNMSLGLSLEASTNLSSLLVSFSGAQELLKGGTGARRSWGWGWRWGERSGDPLVHTGLCPQACGPTIPKACGENMYAKGSCLLLDSRLQTLGTVPTALPGRSPRAGSSAQSTRWRCSCVQSLKPRPPCTQPLPTSPSKDRRGRERCLAWQDG